jgi:predicted ArsR family transcriptional regulator
VVRAKVTSTLPSSFASTDPSIPRSTTLSPSSGSMTPMRARRTASSAGGLALGASGALGATMGRVYKGGPWYIRLMDRLQVFKALGDNTRYAIYLELARAEAPRSTGEIAETLGLHPNTVRPHLERMREVGLLDVEVENRGAVGRPQHRYHLTPDAPSLGLEPPTYPLLSGLLANVAAAFEPEPDQVAEAGRDHGRYAAHVRAPAQPQEDGRPACIAAVMAELADLGFDPVHQEDGETATIAFTHCPFRNLAEAFPELICNLHRGMIEGMVEVLGGTAVERFATLADRDPCQVDLAVR